MAAVLTVLDEDFGRPVAERRAAGQLRLVSQRTSARAIITERVAQEVALLTTREEASLATRSFLVAPAPAETALNPLFARRRPRRIDAAAEITRACAAFEQRRFILLVDDVQLDGLDDEVGLGETSEVIFLHLSPLKGS
ncbi:hypothetical protein CHU93_01570 [Sandarakinorhabdus cyanobacteriorum]|uniref:Uncharacterized protein n=1 Tax=Sandarakinorhabdus cyanobacteriorum TaxID=1981098 RepID=A0A255Z3I0_9SPHN|nr:hypothetical protein [Sandarakinorhabdus cyanobacteriorum]OYQ35484.1 hypothetical protein CHU93_01570 [Sandarakinorhabdus cyanobacteriorum]